MLTFPKPYARAEPNHTEDPHGQDPQRQEYLRARTA